MDPVRPAPGRRFERAGEPAVPGATIVPAELFMPFTGESVPAYVERLRSTHRHLGLLIDAVERGMNSRPASVLSPAPLRPAPVRPASPPPPRLVPVPDFPAPLAPEFVESGDERRAGDDRRGIGHPDRRIGHPDRRHGLPDLRVARAERRSGPRDRRSGRRDRRMGHDRRGQALVKGHSRGEISPVVVFWAVNIACWVAVTAVALVSGIGRW
jgi:hypothetical protein